uniref:(California timema) hypothetical protein n=1 Tax=Timema californicum TaxID=61474 RepID=A0A7R9P4U2_TIMCA|nr:unnamed protein product [Timema californicum]
MEFRRRGVKWRACSVNIVCKLLVISSLQTSSIGYPNGHLDYLKDVPRHKIQIRQIGPQGEGNNTDRFRFLYQSSNYEYQGDFQTGPYSTVLDEQRNVQGVFTWVGSRGEEHYAHFSSGYRPRGSPSPFFPISPQMGSVPQFTQGAYKPPPQYPQPFQQRRPSYEDQSGYYPSYQDPLGKPPCQEETSIPPYEEFTTTENEVDRVCPTHLIPKLEKDNPNCVYIGTDEEFEAGVGRCSCLRLASSPGIGIRGAWVG